MKYLITLCFGFALLPSLTSQANPTRPPTKMTVFISDLHFGVGKDSAGKWHNYEDARWAPEFELFLSEVNRLGSGNTDLMLNGDTFELWQSVQKDCVYANPNLGCTEDEALRRLKIVLRAHTAEVKSLHNFALAKNNRLFIIPGNHDAALLFSRVAGEVLKHLELPSEKAQIMTTGYWLSPDGNVYAEHGHQIGEDLNRFEGWPSPFVTAGKTFLRRPWGEQFVQEFYNEFELKYPTIDNFLDEILGVQLGLEAEGNQSSIHDVGKFVRFYLTKLSWQQMNSTLGADEEAPDWDIQAVRAQGDRFIVESIEPNNILRAVAANALKQGELGVSITELTDKEIVNLCNLRAALKEQADSNRAPNITACPKRSLGAITQALLSSRDRIFAQRLDEIMRNIDRSGQLNHRFTVFIYSHTHSPDAGFRPLQGSGTGWNPIVLNTGAWQRTITRSEFNELRDKLNLNEKAALAHLQPEDLPACYSAVFVEPYTVAPLATLKYWKKEQNGKWKLDISCARR
jgi:Calcineurin-like phosphoesterase